IEAVTASVAADNVRSELSSFIEQVLARLSEKGIANSEAHEAWKRVRETTKEEKAYCRLVGSIGLSPYVSHPAIDAALEKIAGKISDSMLMDLCEAANIGSFDDVSAHGRGDRGDGTVAAGQPHQRSGAG